MSTVSHNESEAMAQRKLFRERRQRMFKALQLLMVSGVIRLANAEPPNLETPGNPVVLPHDTADNVSLSASS